MVPSSAGFLNPVYLLARCIAAMMKLEAKSEIKAGVQPSYWGISAERGTVPKLSQISDVMNYSLFCQDRMTSNMAYSRSRRGLK